MNNWSRCAIIRAIKTMAQGAITLIGSNMVNIIDINWLEILGCVATMGVLSILTSLAGLPEADIDDVAYDEEVVATYVSEVRDEEVSDDEA